MSGTKRRWTEEEIEILKTQISIGKSCSEIAEIIDRTTKSVQHQFNKLGLEKPCLEIGDKINRLTIINKYSISKYGQNVTMVECECECGNKYTGKLSNLVSEHVKSCGCLKAEKASERTIIRNTTHGMGDLSNRLYRIWCAMKNRCSNTNHSEYHNYGGRGISVCDIWKNDFISFREWALSNGYNDNLSLDRIDVNGCYCPDNCRWANSQTQARNRRNNRIDTVYVTAFNETKTLQQWLDDERCVARSGNTICYRIGAGWSPEDAITKPSERNTRK